MQLEPILQAAQRHALLGVLRSNPSWTLADVATLIEQDTKWAPLLQELTVGELVAEPASVTAAHDNAGRPLDRRLLELAKTQHGEAFDKIVLQVIREAGGHDVGAAYLSARVGGPRWKLQQSMTRLVRAGLVIRCGITSATRYREAPAVSEAIDSAAGE